MPHTYTCLFNHIIFSTKDRAPLLTPELKPRLFDYMGGIIRANDATSLLINGPEDHVHILALVPAKIALSDLLRELKGVSSGWVNENFPALRPFFWQSGYAAFSVSKSATETVRNYIADQEQHHRRMTFKEEYLEFLKRHEIDYDERYVFD